MPILAILVVLAGIGWYFVSTSVFGTIQCDGDVPRWMIPSDYDDSGCVPLRPAWEAMLPWNADRQDPVCIGMCAEGVQPYRP